eukprot:Amastigsp_a511595_3.p1 type:complete len:125 gc:universal Amastigsp_a511595_3:50-424(+)
MGVRKCVCAPATHPGSFKCSLHRTPRPSKCSSDDRDDSIAWEQKMQIYQIGRPRTTIKSSAGYGEVAWRALSPSIQPGSFSRKNRKNFQRMPSRLSKVSVASHGERSAGWIREQDTASPDCMYG